MASKKPYQMTPEQLALSEARKAKKLLAAANQQADTDAYDAEAGAILSRPWISVGQTTDGGRPVRVLTWNLLAQCLVRRDLFPTSNCLKASQREQMLFRELFQSNPDIMCLQEVDRLEKLLPALEKAGYTHHYVAGPRKKHGCLIAFKSERFVMVDSRKVEYDYQAVRSSEIELQRYGRSFTTKNIGSLVALKSKQSEDSGFIVATTHLFWHPRYTYERTRQAGILFREVAKFRSELQLSSFPCIIAGDFNFAPDDPAYSLLVGDPLSSEQVEILRPSYVVHSSVDPSVPKTAAAVNEGEDEAVDPDRVITSARPAIDADGLMTTGELEEFFSGFPRAKSAYDEGLSRIAKENGVKTFGERVSISPDKRGYHEPEYTSYTHYWKTTLDYIFVLDPPETQSAVQGLLAPPQQKEMEPGLPQKGVTSSDHVSLSVDLSWRKI